MATVENKKRFSCDICHVKNLSEIDLRHHQAGIRHKRLCMTTSVGHGKKPLQDLIDLSLNDEPILGLEHIVEIDKGGQYLYDCKVCDKNSLKKSIMAFHILTLSHRRKYMQTYHPEIELPSEQDKGYVKLLTDLALELEKKYGRKQIQSCSRKNEEETEAFADIANSGDKPTNVENSNQFAFKRNKHFFHYLRTFYIKDDKDAEFIQKLLSNCNKALSSYEDEYNKDKRQTASEKPSENTKISTGVKGSSTSSSASSALETTPSTKALMASSTVPLMPSKVAPMTPPIESAATELFFTSIKSMEASEVSGVLHNIVATNPAFQGIDVPSLIKYLRDTGKLKES